MIGPFSIQFTTCSAFVRNGGDGRRWVCIGSWLGSTPKQSCEMHVVCTWHPMTWGQKSKITAASRRFDPLKSDYVIDPIVYRTVVVQSSLVGGNWFAGEDSGEFDSKKIADIDADVFDSLSQAYERFLIQDEDPDPGKQ